MTQAGTIPASRRPMPERMTYEEFLAYPHENQHVEWVDGRVMPMPAVTDKHSDLTLHLAATLRLYVESKSLGVIRGDPFNMKVGPNLPGRQPDLLFVRRTNVARLRPTHLEGPADLVIEVISPGSRRSDRVEKFQEYEQGGVPEYLLADPERAQLELYRLVNGRYEEVLPDHASILKFETVQDFWVRFDWLTRWPLHPISAVLKELGIA